MYLINLVYLGGQTFSWLTSMIQHKQISRYMEIVKVKITYFIIIIAKFCKLMPVSGQKTTCIFLTSL